MFFPQSRIGIFPHQHPIGLYRYTLILSNQVTRGQASSTDGYPFALQRHYCRLIPWLNSRRIDVVLPAEQAEALSLPDLGADIDDVGDRADLLLSMGGRRVRDRIRAETDLQWVRRLFTIRALS